MKKIILNTIIILIFMTIFSLNICTYIFAAPKGDRIEESTNIKTYSLSDDVAFKGVFSSNSTFFNIEEWWENTRVEVQVDYTINQLSDDNKDAYIKLSVNGMPFYSQKIFYDADLDVHQLKVYIPSDIVKNGSNELKIETYLRASELPCVDDVNLANWFVIKKSTNIKISFNNIISNNKISDFPYPFLKNQDKNEEAGDLSIVIPDDYSDLEISSAYILNSYLEKLNDTYKNKIDIVKYGDFEKRENTNNIFIGRFNSFPNEYRVENSKNNDCLIKISNSPYSRNENVKNMVILCDNNDNLIKGIKTLENKELLFQLDSNTYYVNKELKEGTISDNKSGKITFNNMGVGKIELNGVFRREAAISYSIPKNRIFSQNDKIKLFIRYSENLDFDKSLVTVYSNDTPIGSKKLEKERASKDELELSLPSDINSTNYLDIKIAFDLELKDTYCEKRKEDMPWALITGDSYLYIGNNDVNGYYFSSYGAPFVKDEMFNDTAMIVPDNLSSDEINSLGKVVGYFGKDVTYNNGDFKVVSNSNVTDNDKKKNIIVYGTPKTNSLILDINDKLWFKYDENYSKFLSNEKLELTELFSSKISNFQFDISKYNDQKVMLVLTSPDSTILKNSLVYLSSTEKLGMLNGDCAIIDENGNIRTYIMKKETSKPVYEKVGELSGNAKILLLIIGLFLAFAVIAISLYLYKNKNTNKINNINRRIRNKH